MADRNHWRPVGNYWSYLPSPIPNAQRIAKAEAYGFIVALYQAFVFRAPELISPHFLLSIIMMEDSNHAYIHDIDFVATFDKRLAQILGYWHRLTPHSPIPSLRSGASVNWVNVLGYQVRTYCNAGTICTKQA